MHTYKHSGMNIWICEEKKELREEDALIKAGRLALQDVCVSIQ